MFEKFSVIDLIKTRSASVCTFAGNIVKFNVQTAQELHFPEYIQFLIEPKSKQFAIRACKEDAPNAVRFSKPEGAQKAQIKISNATVVDMVRKLMDWNAEDTRLIVSRVLFLFILLVQEHLPVTGLFQCFRPTLSFAVPASLCSCTLKTGYQ